MFEGFDQWKTDVLQSVKHRKDVRVVQLTRGVFGKMFGTQRVFKMEVVHEWSAKEFRAIKLDAIEAIVEAAVSKEKESEHHIELAALFGDETTAGSTRLSATKAKDDESDEPSAASN